MIANRKKSRVVRTIINCLDQPLGVMHLDGIEEANYPFEQPPRHNEYDSGSEILCVKRWLRAMRTRPSYDLIGGNLKRAPPKNC
mmetsp:Transcript_27606/g.51496  ORF Transcript_27606/g.51496 Transcript_27606/m.51496 type:complete len:84 (+) Transcript_27606:1023-1274(+)